jgi:hypothetical protein
MINSGVSSVFLYDIEATNLKVVYEKLSLHPPSDNVSNLASDGSDGEMAYPKSRLTSTQSQWGEVSHCWAIQNPRSIQRSTSPDEMVTSFLAVFLR